MFSIFPEFITPVEFCLKLNQREDDKHPLITQQSNYKFYFILVISITNNYLYKY